MGELSRELPKAPEGKRRGISESDERTQKKDALADLGVTKQRASEWEKAASLPASDLDAPVVPNSRWRGVRNDHRSPSRKQGPQEIVRGRVDGLR